MHRKFVEYLILIAAIFCAVSACHAQQPAHRVYNTKDGLPSNTVYRAIQDDEGYLWFSTDKGIARFDGLEFVNFTLHEGIGLPVKILSKDLKGRAWFCYGGRELFYCEGGQIYPYAHNQLVQDSLDREYIETFGFDSIGNLWVGLMGQWQKSSIAFISPEGKWTWYDTHFDDCLIYTKQLPTGWVAGTHIYEYERLLKLEEPTFVPILLTEKNGRLASYELPERYSVTYIEREGKKYLMTGQHGLFEATQNNELTKRGNYDLAYGFCLLDKSKNVFFKVKNNGILQFRGNDIGKKPVHLFKGEQILWVIQDNEGGYWFCTRQYGVYYAASLHVEAYRSGEDIPKGYMNGLFKQSESRLITYMGNSICYFDIGKSSIDTSSVKIDGYVTTLEVRDSSAVFVGYHGPGPNFHKRSNTLNLVSGADGIRFISEGEVLLLKGTDISHWNLNSGQFQWVQVIGKRVYAYHPQMLNHFWYSTEDGVFKSDTGWLSSTAEKLGDKFAAPVLDFIELGQEWVALASVKHGVLLMRGDQTAVFDTSHGLLSNHCQKFYLDGRRHLWVGTDKGISELTFKTSKDSVQMEVLQNIDVHHGLPEKDVKSFVVVGSSIWMATPSSLFKIPKNLGHSIGPTHNFPIYINEIRHEGLVHTSHEIAEFKHRSGPIEIGFSGLYYRDPESVQYQYKLTKGEGGWNTTSHNRVTYDELAPGEYTFQVRAVNSTGLHSLGTAKWSFVIHPPFWQTLWFLGIVIALALVLVYLVVHFRVRYVRKREKLLQTAMSYRDQALRSQMNPHFIYNTLNGIQSYIITEQKEISSKYLTKFSRLVRMVFNHSSQQLISLNDELEALNLYLELEVFRYDDHIDYVQKIDQQIDGKMIGVPPMILQPFVENALIHGILPKDQKGVLELEIRLLHNYLEFSIKDDGPGIDISSKGNAQRKGGSQITFDRIRQFNEENHFSGQTKFVERENGGIQVYFQLALKTISQPFY